MSISDDRKAYVFGRLHDWAAANRGGVGGPRLASAMLGGGRAEYGSRSLVSLAVDEVECCWRGLPDAEKYAIKEAFFHADASVEQHCRALGVSRATFHRRVCRGIELMSSALRECRAA